jgi:hypothetical protein
MPPQQQLARGHAEHLHTLTVKAASNSLDLLVLADNNIP